MKDMNYLSSLPDFEYRAPDKIQEVVEILYEWREEAKLLAGGTDLLVKMKKREDLPSILVDIKKNLSFNYIYQDEGLLRIGATTSYLELENSPLIKDTLIYQAVISSVPPTLRYIATIGGNVGNASPAADLIPPLLVLDGVAKVIGEEGEREILLKDLFAGPGRTSLAPDEVITEFQISNIDSNERGAFIKVPARTQKDLASVNIATIIRLNPDNRECENMKMALGGVAPTPLSFEGLENVIEGEILKEKNFEEIERIVDKKINPISDIRGSSDYKRNLSKVLIRRVMRKALSG